MGLIFKPSHFESHHRAINKTPPVQTGVLLRTVTGHMRGAGDGRFFANKDNLCGFAVTIPFQILT